MPSPLDFLLGGSLGYGADLGGFGANPPVVPPLPMLPTMGTAAPAPAPEATSNELSSFDQIPDEYLPEPGEIPPFDTASIGPQLRGLLSLPQPRTDPTDPLWNPEEDARQKRDAERAAAALPRFRTERAPEDDEDIDEAFQPHNFKQTLIERGIPAIVAAIAGMTGGGMAAATGMLGGTAKGLETERAFELEQAKLESARRDRRRQRRDTRDQRDWQHLQDRASASSQLMQRIAEFESPVAAKAWLMSPTVRETYGAMGIDTEQMGAAVAPALIEKVQTQARDRFEKEMKHVQSMYPQGIPDEQSVLDNYSVRFQGVDMTMRELADFAGAAANKGDKQIPLMPKNPGSADAVVQLTIEKFKKDTGRMPDAGEQLDMTIAALKERAEATKDPALAALLRLRVQQAEFLAGNRAEMARAYSPEQQTNLRTLQAQYVKGSEEFAQVANFYNQIRGTVERAKNTDTHRASPVAQVSLVFQYLKMVDPRSTVRDGERATLAKAQRTPARIFNLYNALIDGQTMSNEMVDQILVEAQQAYNDSKKPHDRLADDIAQSALNGGLQPWDILRDYNAFDDPMQVPGAPRPRRRAIDREGRITEVDDRGQSVAPNTSRNAPPTAAPHSAAPPAAPAKPPLAGVAGALGGKPAAKPPATVAPSRQNVQTGKVIKHTNGKYYMVTGVPANGGGVETEQVQQINGVWYYTGSGEPAPVKP